MKRCNRMLVATVAVSLALLGGPSRGFAQPAAAPPIQVVPAGEGLFSVQAEDARLGDVLDQLHEVAAIDLEMPAVLRAERVTVSLTEANLEQIVAALAGSHALVYERNEDGSYRLVSARVTSQEQLEARRLKRAERRDVARKKKVALKAAQEIEGLYGYAGVLDYDQAKALVGERKSRFEALVAELAAMGPGGARAMAAAFTEVDGTRSRLAMIEALGKIEDPEAPLVLGSLLEGDSNFSLRREMVAALGHIGNNAAAQEVLTSVLASEDDMRLQAASVMALSGQDGAVTTLAGVAASEDMDNKVRRETVRSLGEIGTPEAEQALAEVALSSPDKGVRQSAIQELARTFADDALPTLETLLGDPDTSVGINAVKAVSRIGTPAAQDLLTRTAASGSSEGVREWASAYLARNQVVTTGE